MENRKTVELITLYVNNGENQYKPERVVRDLVRCKDCKNLGYTNSHWFCKWLNRCVDEDWFCADGKVE